MNMGIIKMMHKIMIRHFAIFIILNIVAINRINFVDILMCTGWLVVLTACLSIVYMNDIKNGEEGENFTDYIILFVGFILSILVLADNPGLFIFWGHLMPSVYTLSVFYLLGYRFSTTNRSTIKSAIRFC